MSEAETTDSCHNNLNIILCLLIKYSHTLKLSKAVLIWNSVSQMKLKVQKLKPVSHMPFWGLLMKMIYISIYPVKGNFIQPINVHLLTFKNKMKRYCSLLL